MMRRLQVGLVLVVLCFTASAWASVVIPGASNPLGVDPDIFVPDTFTFAAGMISTGTCSNTTQCDAMDADLLSAVYRNDATGNLLFLWQIINLSPALPIGVSIDSVNTWRFYFDSPGSQFSAPTFGDTTDAALVADLFASGGLTAYSMTGAVAPFSIVWNAPITAIVQATFFPTIDPGENSTIWWAYTDAKNFTQTDPNQTNNRLTAQAHAHETADTLSMNFDTFEPAPVPEPASLFLMGSGLVGLAGMMRRKLAK